MNGVVVVVTITIIWGVTVTIAILLKKIRCIGAIIADISSAVVVAVQLVFIGMKGAIIGGVVDVVFVFKVVFNVVRLEKVAFPLNQEPGYTVDWQNSCPFQCCSNKVRPVVVRTPQPSGYPEQPLGPGVPPDILRRRWTCSGGR